MCTTLKSRLSIMYKVLLKHFNQVCNSSIFNAYLSSFWNMNGTADANCANCIMIITIPVEMVVFIIDIDILL